MRLRGIVVGNHLIDGAFKRDGPVENHLHLILRKPSATGEVLALCFAHLPHGFLE
jgi:hypothetical protein